MAVVESGGPAFDLAAVAAAKQFVFTPATVDGTPIPVKIAYRYQFTFTEKLIKKQTADFEGVVRDRHTKQPMANVRILVDTGQEALTDEQGKFRILDIVPGDHLVTISGESLATVGTTETFEASKKIDATYEVDKKKANAGNGEEDEEIVVTAPRLKKQVVSTEVQATQAAKVPGTQGRRPQGRREPARRRAGRGGLVVARRLGLRAARHARLRRRRPRAAPLPRGRVSLDPPVELRQVRRARAGRIRSELWPRPRRPGDGRDAAPRRGGRARERRCRRDRRVG